MERKLTKQERKARNADFKRREQPRIQWDSTRKGTYIRKKHGPLPGYEERAK